MANLDKIVDNFIIENQALPDCRKGDKGHNFETLILGYSGREVSDRLSSYFRDELGNKITDLWLLVAITKNIQNQLCNCNPRNPSTEILKILYDEIFERLRRSLPEGRLSIYHSAGTPLDYKFGADLFFAYKCRSWREVIVTVDLTVSSRRNKEENSNAEMILTLGDLRNNNLPLFIDMISSKLVKKANKHGNVCYV